jgi:hypothetical protein
MKKMVIIIIMAASFMIPQLVMGHCHGPHKPKAPDQTEQR